jgi:hypothetical protein
MNELIDAIKAWPVIVQGALGSALFWLVLVLGQRIRAAIAVKHSHYSKTARLSWLVSEQIKYSAFTATTMESQSHHITFLLYRASRPALKSLMWLIYGLVMDSIAHPAGVIGYMVSLVFLFRAFEIIGPVVNDNPQETLKSINEEIEKLNAA